VLDSGKRALAVRALGSLGGLLDYLRNVTATGGTDGPDAIRTGVVAMASRACYSVISHVYKLILRIR
jgi:hypothetical protein